MQTGVPTKEKKKNIYKRTCTYTKFDTSNLFIFKMLDRQEGNYLIMRIKAQT